MGAISEQTVSYNLLVSNIGIGMGQEKVGWDSEMEGVFIFLLKVLRFRKGRRSCRILKKDLRYR